MPRQQPDVLAEQLEQKQQALDMVLAIDAIRDTTPDPMAMLAAILNVLTDLFGAGLGLIALNDPESDQVELKIVKDQSSQPVSIERPFLEQAARLDKITIWDANTVTMPAGLETGQLVVVPIIMDKKRLGTLLLGRSQPVFNNADLALLKIAESMVDSAVVQGYTHYQLQQYIKELETIYRVDHIRDQNLPFEEMLDIVVREMCKVVDADIGFIMLYDRAQQKLELRSVTDADFLQVAGHAGSIEQFANQALTEARLVYHNDPGSRLQSLMCLPLILKDEIIGVLGVINGHHSDGFTADDRRLLSAIGSQIDTAVFEKIEQRRLRGLLGRSVGPQIMDHLLANPDVGFLQGERMVVTVLYGDLRGSTSLAERTEPELLVKFINDYLGKMTEVILANKGTLDKFVGDEVMALFGAPYPQDDHALFAVTAGLQMQQVHREVMEHWHTQGMEPAPLGIGIATGELIVGEMGSPQRTDFTVIGRAANLGARICSVAKAGEVLVSESTFELIAGQVTATAISGQVFKGFDYDLMVYRIERLGTSGLIDFN
jgi:adenylate cyclase